MVREKIVDVEELKMDLASMIDVVFLLIIFFIMIPPKELDALLKSNLGKEGDQSVVTPKTTEPFSIDLRARALPGGEMETTVFFNQEKMFTMRSLSMEALDRLYASPQSEELLADLAALDEKRLDPMLSEPFAKLMRAMENSAAGAQEGKKTKVILHAASNVPFKLVLAILNVGAGAEFDNLQFTKPSQEIWNPRRPGHRFSDREGRRM